MRFGGRQRYLAADASHFCELLDQHQTGVDATNKIKIHTQINAKSKTNAKQQKRTGVILLTNAYHVFQCILISRFMRA